MFPVAWLVLTSCLAVVTGLTALQGYGLRQLQAVQAGDTQDLPDWAGWRAHAGLGLRYWLAFLPWGLPGVLIYGLMGAIARLGPALESWPVPVAVSITLLPWGLLLAWGLFLLLAWPGITIAFGQQQRLRDAWAARHILRWTWHHWRMVCLWVQIAVAAGLGLFLILSVLLWAMPWELHTQIISPALVATAMLLSVPLVMCVLYPFHFFGQMAHQ